MAAIAQVPAGEVLANGSSWAALDTMLRRGHGNGASGREQVDEQNGAAGPGGDIAAGRRVEDGAVLTFAVDREDPDARPWLELVEDGTFSNRTLHSTPTSYAKPPP
jgi:hypothetical protein